ncbi:MAG: lipopolysaccharide transport system permease protein [Pyrinomonadaceae bacterium]|jgi:lipopolysaccharide transport system permease protein|nr:lipopolysaccharide transport system permease protein [Pyrinomonadaceae bacterium]
MDSNTSEPIASPHHVAATPVANHAPPTPRTTAAADGDDALVLPDRPLILIESEETGVQFAFADLWSYRELLYFLTWRDIKVRYKQTALGAAWAIIQPLATMLLFTLVFNRLAGLDTGRVPYPLFAYTGLLIWTFFSNAVINSTNSLINNTNLITKVYFPRAFIPAAAVAAGMVDLAIAGLILCGLVVYYGVAPTWGLALVPLFLLLAVLLALAVGMLISALTVKYRDLRHALPFLIQFWMFASPVIYPASRVPGGWRQLIALNPLTGIIEGFRAALFGGAFDRAAIVLAVFMTLVLLAASFYLFRRIEETFADII